MMDCGSEDYSKMWFVGWPSPKGEGVSCMGEKQGTRVYRPTASVARPTFVTLAETSKSSTPMIFWY